jgi:hypothetical protein
LKAVGLGIEEVFLQLVTQESPKEDEDVDAESVEVQA